MKLHLQLRGCSAISAAESDQQEAQVELSLLKKGGNNGHEIKSQIFPAVHDSCILLRHHLIAVIHNKRILQINYQRLKTQTCNKFRLPELFSIFEHHILTFRMCFLFHPFPTSIFQIPTGLAPCWSASAAKICCRGSWAPWTPATSGAWPSAARSCTRRPQGRRAC